MCECVSNSLLRLPVLLALNCSVPPWLCSMVTKKQSWKPNVYFWLSGWVAEGSEKSTQVLALVRVWISANLFPSLGGGCSVSQSCLTLCDPRDCSMLGFPILHYLPKWLRFISTELVMPSNHLILCCHLLLLLQPFPASGLFPMSRLFPSGEELQSIGASASASVLPMIIQGWLSPNLCTTAKQWESSLASPYFLWQVACSFHLWWWFAKRKKEPCQCKECLFQQVTGEWQPTVCCCPENSVAPQVTPDKN